MHNAKHSLKRSMLSFFLLYILFPITALLALGVCVEHKSASIALETSVTGYFKQISNVCSQHTNNLSTLLSLLQDSETIRTKLTELHKNPNPTDLKATSIAEISDTPLTYNNCFNNFSVNAVAIFSDTTLVYYSIQDESVDLPLERMRSVNTIVANTEYKEGQFVTDVGHQSAYAYYVQDYQNIYNGRYYGKIIIELLPIASNIPSAGGTYLPASDHSLDLEACPSAKYYLCDKNQLVIFSNDSSCIGGLLSMHNSVLALSTDLMEFEGKYCWSTPLSDADLTLYITADKSDFPVSINYLPFALLGSVLIVYFIIFFLIFRNFYSPLDQFFSYCSTVAAYDTPIPPAIELPYQEFSDVLYLHKKYAEQYAALQKQCQKLEREKADIRYQSLQSQMDPHFVFNILDIIGWKAAQNSSADVTTMINNLSDMLRYEIQTEEFKIPIRQEINHIQQYLSLRQLNTPEPFTYAINADAELLDKYFIPKLILQPLVENAIVHGIVPSGRTGNVQIDIWEDMDGIMCRITDNGVGFDPETVMRADTPVSEKHNHVALKNIQERLLMLYDRPYGLTIHSTPGAGTVATVYIPFDPIPQQQGVDFDV